MSESAHLLSAALIWHSAARENLKALLVLELAHDLDHDIAVGSPAQLSHPGCQLMVMASIVAQASLEGRSSGDVRRDFSCGNIDQWKIIRRQLLNLSFTQHEKAARLHLGPNFVPCEWSRCNDSHNVSR
jgi:hypothetical protein